ncbi:hypothetical protein A2V80_01035 [Candidatus Woesebacteria bacterium RBG_16_39_8b]|uniref:Uncharacterized protein n=1 Tax=Candidatus Woesebacteria bacterium RBG_16_39_8b TaxID=1802482 RepID=A0A1F7XFQ8_9BACT|nr:MAG: hypothetical protein A2V80_01035 [Candidatus Woesebacteria bacterium RBG_16_39_8b]
MSVDQEPKVIKKKIRVRDYWNQNRVDRVVEVSSGPLPTHEKLLPLDGTGEETVVEGMGSKSKRSPQFPAEKPIHNVPLKGALDD